MKSSDHVFVSDSIDFLSNLQQDALFWCIAYDYSHADWQSWSAFVIKDING